MLDAAPDPSTRPAEADGTAQDHRRTQILEAARACFTTAGFHGASMHQICAAAKMSPGALYRYFPSKDAIIEAIAEEERAKAATVMEPIRRDGPLLDRFTAAAIAYLRLMQAREAGSLMIEVCAESLRNTAVGERFHCIEHDVRSELVSAMSAAKAAGEIPADLDVGRAMQVLYSVVDGLVLRMALESDLTAEVVEPFLRRIFAAVLGIRAETP